MRHLNHYVLPCRCYGTVLVLKPFIDNILINMVLLKLHIGYTCEILELLVWATLFIEKLRGGEDVWLFLILCILLLFHMKDSFVLEIYLSVCCWIQRSPLQLWADKCTWQHAGAHTFENNIAIHVWGHIYVKVINLLINPKAIKSSVLLGNLATLLHELLWLVQTYCRYFWFWATFCVLYCGIQKPISPCFWILNWEVMSFMVSQKHS